MNIPPNPSSFSSPGNMKPMWHPPIEPRWILTILIIFLASVASRMPPSVLNIFVNPIGFFMTSLISLAVYRIGFAPGAFAILFFLLLVWSANASKQAEGFLSASNTVDWVTNSERWFVEKTLKERPLGIQEKSVNTFPVQGATSQTSNASGTT
jgi:hypothetical protein